jgi:hypothetical protein
VTDAARVSALAAITAVEMIGGTFRAESTCATRAGIAADTASPTVAGRAITGEGAVPGVTADATMAPGAAGSAITCVAAITVAAISEAAQHALTTGAAVAAATT